MVQDLARRAEKTRDLKGQIAELSAEEDGEIVFLDISPQRRLVTVYSTLDGEPIPVPAYMLQYVMDSRLPDGQFRFTSDATKVPEYKLGEIKCFLHSESPERPILDQIGLAGKTCPAAHLPNSYSKRLHAEHRHRKEWAAYQDYLGEKEREKHEARQERQLEATLELARIAAAGGKTEAGTTAKTLSLAVCGDCGWKKESPNPEKALAFHQRMHCPSRKAKDATEE